MDQRLERALSLSNYRRTIEIRRRTLRRRLDTQCIVYHQNGMFLANQKLIGYVAALILSGISDAIIIDKNDIPIEITDLKEFLTILQDKHFIAMNEYYVEYQKTTQARNVQQAMDLDD